MGAGVQLWGWDDTNKVWVKVLVNAAGKLIIDPTEILEEPPTNGEMGKAATSNWSFDHDADPDAHHARLHDHSLAADGTPIAVAGVPNLDTSKITTGRFVAARLLDGTSGYFLKAAGAGLDPAYALLAEADIPAHMAKSKLSFTLNKLLKGAGAGADPTEIDVPGAATCGAYLGNSTVNRAISHGLGVLPKLLIFSTSAVDYLLWTTQPSYIYALSPTAIARHLVTTMTATYFYVGNSTDYAQSGNMTGVGYYWLALG